MTELQPNILNAECPSRYVVELLGNKWTLLVLAAITRGVNRHNALLREIGGISQKMLAQTLRELERNGLVIRTVYPVIPPMVDYTLTPLGLSLAGMVAAMGRWAEEQYALVRQAREQYDRLNG